MIIINLNRRKESFPLEKNNADFRENDFLAALSSEKFSDYYHFYSNIIFGSRFVFE